MKITTTVTRNTVAIQYGFIGIKLDYNQLETSIEVLSSLAKATGMLTKEQLREITSNKELLIGLIHRFKSVVVVQTELDDWKTVVEMDIDPETLVGDIRIIEQAELDKDMIVSISFKELFKLVAEIQTLKSKSHE